MKVERSNWVLFPYPGVQLVASVEVTPVVAVPF